MTTRTTLRSRLLARIPSELCKTFSKEFSKRVFSCGTVQQDVLLERFILAKHFWTAAAHPSTPSGPSSSVAKQLPPPAFHQLPAAFLEDDLEVCSSMGGYFLPDSISGLTKQRLLSYEPPSDARFLSQLLKAQGYVPQGQKVTTTATSPVSPTSHCCLSLCAVCCC